MIDSFDSEDEARFALASIVDADPAGADEFAMIAYDEAGEPVGDALVGSELASPSLS